ncbi:hypothetical protein C7A18_10825, partial [Streptococcus suis]|uniref:hypothetical protein n=1 Tax=Streptococcus suis TaxID=1307 RepID=UPI001F87AA20|nr:hypothetical protein [Streptococcus suis]
GYLIKPFVRDKDAIQAVLMVAEIAAYYRSRGMTLADGIDEIFKEYGYFAEKAINCVILLNRLNFLFSKRSLARSFSE